MRNSKEVWEQRVSEWKSSGQTSIEFSKDKDFSPTSLRYWSSRLKNTLPAQSQNETERPSVRFAKIVSFEPPIVTEQKKKPSIQVESNNENALILDMKPARIIVRPGFDKPTLEKLLDCLEARGSK